ncbi:MAG: AI-2E family transporter [Pseudohongiellaceae bacterium]
MREIIERRMFFALLASITLLFLWLLQPFWSAIFWAFVMTLIFFPLQRRLQQYWPGRRNTTALITLLTGTLVVVLPAVAIVFAFVAEGISLYQSIESREIDPETILEQIGAAVPWLPELLQRFGVDTGNVREYLSSAAVTVSQWLGQEAVSFGRNTVSFTLRMALMLYLVFFLLRDGDRLAEYIRQAIPLDAERNQLLFGKFVEVTRATVKGNLLVAIIQGALGGLIFFILGIAAPILWAVVMAFLSLIPAVGAFLVWFPVAVYLYATGDWISATVLIAYGAIIIGLADNVLRPILVGRDTKLPDYIVLFSTLGGIAVVGINGFVVGPLIAALFLAFWTTFIRDFSSRSE